MRTKNSYRLLTMISLLITVFIVFLSYYENRLHKVILSSQDMDIKRYLGLNQKDYEDYTGRGINVAIVDTGIAPHKDINKERVLFFKDFINDKNEPYDDNGHGTSVAGIIGANGTIRGIAPNVNFIILKILDENACTNVETLEKAIKWIVDNRNKYNIKIVNLSLGIPVEVLESDEKEDKIFGYFKELKDMNTIVICSAGNTGENVLYPAQSKDVITVGYVNNKRTYDYSDDTVALLSCKEDKIRYPKPDLVTLGVDVLSLDYKKIDGYTKKSGSSMATAIVSGVSALLIEKYSDSNVSEIESILKDGTIYLENSEPSSQGKGELCFLRKNAKTPIP